MFFAAGNIKNSYELWHIADSTLKGPNNKIFPALIKNQRFIVIIPKSIFLQP
jgi:hypothetical protein